MPVALLYERLVTVDKVDALLSPYISARSAFAIAQQYNVRALALCILAHFRQIPIFNIGDFAYVIPRVPLILSLSQLCSSTRQRILWWMGVHCDP